MILYSIRDLVEDLNPRGVSLVTSDQLRDVFYAFNPLGMP